MSCLGAVRVAGGLRHERLELRDELVGPAELEVGVDPVLERGDVRAPRAARSPPGRTARTRSRRAARPGRARARIAAVRPPPPCHRRPARRARPRSRRSKRSRSSSSGRDPSAYAVPTVRRVSGPSGKLLAEGGNTVLEHLGGGRWRVLTPEQVDDDVSRQRLVRAQEQEGQHRPLPRSSQRETALAVERLEWPQNAVVHTANLRRNVHLPGQLLRRWAAMGDWCSGGYRSRGSSAGH